MVCVANLWHDNLLQMQRLAAFSRIVQLDTAYRPRNIAQQCAGETRADYQDWHRIKPSNLRGESDQARRQERMPCNWRQSPGQFGKGQIEG